MLFKIAGFSHTFISHSFLAQRKKTRPTRLNTEQGEKLSKRHEQNQFTKCPIPKFLMPNNFRKHPLKQEQFKDFQALLYKLKDFKALDFLFFLLFSFFFFNFLFFLSFLFFLFALDFFLLTFKHFQVLHEA
jgi:hypothetical protein